MASAGSPWEKSTFFLRQCTISLFSSALARRNVEISPVAPSHGLGVTKPSEVQLHIARGRGRYSQKYWEIDIYRELTGTSTLRSDRVYYAPLGILMQALS